MGVLLGAMRYVAGALLVLLATPVLAQSLPYHADPDAREMLPSLTPIPAIRFLTTADFPPFNFRDETGQLVGFNIDLAKRICAEVNVACTIQAWPWDQAAEALSDSQGDALIAGLAMTEENGALFDFSSTYLALPGRFVTRADDAGDFRPDGLVEERLALRAIGDDGVGPGGELDVRGETAAAGAHHARFANFVGKTHNVWTYLCRCVRLTPLEKLATRGSCRFRQRGVTLPTCGCMTPTITFKTNGSRRIWKPS